MRNPALDAWGDYDRDDPFPLFAAGPGRRPGARGHAGRRAPRVARRPARGGHGPRSTTPACPRTCTPRSPATARWSPRACPAPPSPGTCSASTRPTTPGCAGWPRRRSPAPGSRRFEPRVQAIVGRAARRPRRRAATDRRRPGHRLRLPAAVHRDQRAARRPANQTGTGSGAGSPRCSRRRRRPSRRPRRWRPRRHRAVPDRAGRPQAGRPGRGPGHRPGARAPTSDGALYQQELLSTIFQLVVAGHDTTTSLIGNGVGRPARATPTSATRWSPTRPWCRGRSRRSCAGTRPSRTRRSATPRRTSPSAGPSSRPAPR